MQDLGLVHVVLLEPVSVPGDKAGAGCLDLDFYLDLHGGSLHLKNQF